MSTTRLVNCRHCEAANELPAEALTYGSYRCHACGQVNPVPDELRPRPVEQPVPAPEPVQTGPSYVPSSWNTPEATRRAEQEASRVGCLVGLLLGLGAR